MSGHARRGLLQALLLGAAAGLPMARAVAGGHAPEERLYDLPDPPPGSISLLHFSDSHAQLLPLWYREPSVNLGAGAQAGVAPHLPARALLRNLRVPEHSALAHALTALDYESAARRFGRVGGFAHLATLVARLRSARPGALLLDGGDTWQGSGLSLRTQGADMLAATCQLGVDAMTGHWEFTLGATRVQAMVRTAQAQGTTFLAQNVRTADFGDAVFAPSMLREIRGVQVAVIGEAYPYTALAHPRRFVEDWTFGLQEEALQREVDVCRAQGAQVVVVLSHCGLDIDLKLASRLRDVDVILGGHTHDPLLQAVRVANPGGSTLVTNAGSHGKFLSVLDLQVRHGRVRGLQHRLLPVFARALPADPAMHALITQLRAPHLAELQVPLARTDGLLYRRGNFNGTFDQLILLALLEELDAEIALSPGFRWGGAVLPGETITRERLLDQTAITYPAIRIRTMTGSELKALLEDVADNLFNPDPYLQQGGDMVRTGNLQYRLDTSAAIGSRISHLRVGNSPLVADRRYKVAGWAATTGTDQTLDGPPVWEVVERWLRRHPQVPALEATQPG